MTRTKEDNNMNTYSPQKSLANRLLTCVGILILLTTVFTVFYGSQKASAAACTAPSTDLGSVTSTVSIPQSGSYRIWTRMLSPNATDNSYLLEIDGNTCFTVGDGSFNVNSWASNSSNWVDYQSGNTSSKINMTLSAGNHTIKMIGNAPNVQIDRVIFTSDSGCVPSGVGDNCANPPDTWAPTVGLTSPADQSSYKGNNIVLSADASDDTGGSGIKKVEFWIDGAKNSEDTTAPYSVTIGSSTLSVGSHTIVAKAFDNANNSASSTTRTITVKDSVSPTGISITSPSGGSTQTGTISVSASASDNVGLAKIEFYVDNNKVGEDSATPFSISLDTRTLSNGNHSLTAKAFDAEGNAATSSAVTINVSNSTTPPPDKTPPTVSLTNPANGSTLSNSIWIDVVASDDVGVTKVEFYVDDKKTSKDDTTVPFSQSLDTKTLSNGSHTLRARAYDGAGNATWSASISINVNNVVYIDEDVNMDGVVNTSDIGSVIKKYKQTGSNLGREDVNKNGIVDMSDIGAIIKRYGYGR